MLDEKMWQLAQLAGNISGLPPEWIYAQWVHESTNVDKESEFYGQPFKSDMARLYNNLGGVTQEEENDTPQPDGNFYYKQFASLDDYADYFGRYLRLYREDGIFEAQTIPEYAAALYRGNYFTDELENYVAGMQAAYKEAFG